MNWSKEFIEYTERAWQVRREQIKSLSEKADRYIVGCGEEEALLLKYVLGTVPLSDISDYDLSLFAESVRHAWKIREEFPWVRELPERLFLLYVLPSRINTEQLEPCRPLFCEGLRERVSGLSLKDTILEVNRWCAEHVTYRSTDDRTASALAVYSCGWGRCGEESTFAVNALRSVGIPARQIYAPWWSHCDDNHAWVEAWDGTAWRYLGACEPEPELDRGWFTTAASRAMMIHTRVFLTGTMEECAFLFPDVDPADLRMEDGVVYETVTDRYADTVLLRITIRSEDRTPVPGAEVTCSILNMAAFEPITVLKTGQDGEVLLRVGKGSLYLSAFLDGSFAEALIDTAHNREVDLTLRPFRADGCWTEFDFTAPVGMVGYPPQLTEEQKDLRIGWLEDAARLRREHHPENEGVVQSPFETRVLGTLTEKDRAVPVPAAVFADCEQALAWECSCPAEIFEPFLLSPRIGLEPLFPWRKAISEALTTELTETFRKDPRAVWPWITQHVGDSSSYAALPGTPAAALALGCAVPSGKDALFCAVCRTVGVPARLAPLDGQPEYWQNGEFHPLFAERTALVTLHAPEGEPANPRQNFTLSVFADGKFVPLLSDPIQPGCAAACRVVPGIYRVITTVRLPNGGQLARRMDLSLSPGETRDIHLEFREMETAHLFTDILLPPIALRNARQGERTSADLLAQQPLALLFWLEPGREPTEHILNELRETAAEFAELPCAIHLILPDLAQRDNPTLQKALDLLPQAQVWQGDFRDTVPALARRLFTDPEKLPLISLANCKGKSLYSVAGYNVGTAELLVHLISSLREE